MYLTRFSSRSRYVSELTEFPIDSLQCSRDCTNAYCTTDSHCVSLGVDFNFLEFAQIKLNAVLDLAQGPSVAVTTTSSKERNIVLVGELNLPKSC